MKSNESASSHESLKPAIVFLSWMTLCYLVSFAAYEGTTQGIWFWYVALDRPSWCPPTWSATPTWTILYGLMGLAIWQAAKEPPSRIRSWGLGLFFAQLALNGFWPWLFFAWHKIGATIWVLGLLLAVVLATMIVFGKLRPPIAWLMAPTLAAIAFTGILDIVLWRMNR